jgi:putative hydrolase of the HAD superfamily
VHVGDDFNCDVVGAKRAGFKAIWLTEDKQQPAPSTPYLATEDIEAAKHFSADAVISSTAAIVATVNALQNSMNDNP